MSNHVILLVYIFLPSARMANGHCSKWEKKLSARQAGRAAGGRVGAGCWASRFRFQGTVQKLLDLHLRGLSHIWCLCLSCAFCPAARHPNSPPSRPPSRLPSRLPSPSGGQLFFPLTTIPDGNSCRG